MATRLTGFFDTRRSAELAVERLVQEYGVKRDQIVVKPPGEDNTAGVAPPGGDAEHSGQEAGDAALNGRIAVSLAAEDDEMAHRLRAAIQEFRAD